MAAHSPAMWTGNGLLRHLPSFIRVLKPGRFCVSFYGWNKVDQFFAAWKGAGFSAVGHLVWVKRYTSSRGMLAYQHEQAYLLVKGKGARPRFPLPDVLDWQYTGNPYQPDAKAGEVAKAGH